MPNRYKGKPPLGKKARKPTHEVDYRPLQICEAELDWLLKVATKNPRKFPSSLRNRLQDLKVIFSDQLLKLKELIKTGKANSFYMDEVTAVTGKNRGKNKPFAKQTYPEIACPTPQQMKALLAKEAKQNGADKG